MSKAGRPQQSQAGFVTLKEIPCPDCRDNELGRPFLSRIGPSVSKLVPSKHRKSCETCGGSHHIQLAENDPQRIDPYALK
jgi:hypothetical protein